MTKTDKIDFPLDKKSSIAPKKGKPSLQTQVTPGQWTMKKGC